MSEVLCFVFSRGGGAVQKVGGGGGGGGSVGMDEWGVGGRCV